MRTDEAIRTALQALAGEARPVDLVQPALRAGRRRRRLRDAVASGAIAAVMLGIVAAGFAVRPGRGQPTQPVGRQASPPVDASAPAPARTQTTLDGGTARVIGTRTPAPLIASWYPQTRTHLYDAIHHTYVDVAGDQIWPSLSGTAVAFTRSDDNSTVYLTDFSTGATTTLAVPGSMLNPQWTSDGSRLLFTVSAKNGDGHIDARIYNLRTHAWTGFTVGVPAAYCVWCELSWLPDGQRIAMSKADRSIPYNDGGAEVESGLQLFSDTGTKLAYLPIRGRVAGAGAWSADGASVLVTGTEQRNGVWVEVPQLYRTDGTFVADLGVVEATPYWVDSTRLLLVENYAKPGNGSQQQWWIALRGSDGLLIDRWIDPDQLVATLSHGV